MPTAPCHSSPVLDCLKLPLPTDRTYAELLQAHEQARALGQPLLTEAGVSYLERHLCLAEEGLPSLRDAPPDLKLLRGHDPLPAWDPAERKLYLGDRLLHEFKQRAPQQIRLLDAFQEQGWTPARIDDPLPWRRGGREEDRKERLRQTIKNLNRGLPPDTIRFRGDGTGEGVIWEHDR
jgi:hypothetical protein